MDALDEVRPGRIVLSALDAQGRRAGTIDEAKAVRLCSEGKADPIRERREVVIHCERTLAEIRAHEAAMLVHKSMQHMRQNRTSGSSEAQQRTGDEVKFTAPKATVISIGSARDRRRNMGNREIS